MFLYLLFLFTVVPACELYLLIQAGKSIGVMETIWIILITGVVGAAFAKSQGRALMVGIQADLSRGAVPENKLIQGLLVIVGGILLITPGFMTDIFGLCMVFPVTRIPFAIFLKSKFKKMVSRGQVKFYGNMGGVGVDYNSHFGGHHESSRDVTPNRQVIDITSNNSSQDD